MRALLVVILLLSGCAHDYYVVERVTLKRANALPPGERRNAAIEAWRDGGDDDRVWLRLGALDRNPSEPSPARGLVRVRLREPRWGAIVGGAVLAVGAAVLAGGLWRSTHYPGGELPDMLGLFTTASGAVQSVLGATFLFWGLFEKPWIAHPENRDVAHVERPPWVGP